VLRAFREFVTSLAWAAGDPRGFQAPKIKLTQEAHAGTI
jgi:hypothetical protein